MNLGKKFLAALAVAGGVAWSSFATDYYVAKTGVDDDAEGRGRSAEMPYLTITNALKKAQTSGDHVYVAEGTYVERDLEVASGVGLIATGRRDYTTIDANASSTDNARCAKVLANAYIKGFTLKNGWVPSSPETNGGGVSAASSAAIIDCAFRNCRGHRGGGCCGGYWIRCYFASDNTGGWHTTASGGYGPSAAFNCVFDGAGCVAPNARIINCTFTANGRVGSNDGNSPALVYNSHFAGSSDKILNGAKFYASVLPNVASNYVAVKGYDSATLFNPTITSSSTSVAIGSDFTPYAYSTDLHGRGNQTTYETYFPAAWKEIGEWRKCYAGNERLRSDTHNDVGACQYDYWATDGLMGYDYTKEAVSGEDKVKFTFTRNSKSYLPLVTLTFGGETVDYTQQAAGYAFVVTLDGALTDDFLCPAPTYANVTDWYVDADNGSDENTGYDSDFPFKTIAKAITRAKSGHVIHLAEATATYDAGNTLPIGVGLVADGARDKTVIDGGGTKKGLILAAYTCYVKGIRFQNCYGGGVYPNSSSSGAIVLCSFYSCTGSWRGGAGPGGGVWIGCYFDSTNSDTSGVDKGRSLYSPSAAVSCVFNGQGTWGGGYYLILNCSYLNGARFYNNNPGAVAYNSLVYETGNNCYFTNSVSPNANNGLVKADADSLFSAGAATIALDSNYAPLITATNLIAKGKKSYYDEKFPSFWAQFKNLDFNGRARFGSNGSLDRGACQCDYWRTDGALGFDYVKEDAGDGKVKFTFTRNSKYVLPLVSLSFGGETVNFDDEAAGYQFVVTVEGALTDNFPAPEITYAASTPDFYVDPVNGRDTERGYRREFACKTLAAVATNATDGSVIHAAAGVYDKGEMPGSVTSSAVSTNRVIVPANVGLVAEEGPEKTFIIGSFGAVTLGDAAAIRCVRLNEGSYVKGFTITGGAAAYCDGGKYSANGGGVFGYQSTVGSAAIGCVITNCAAARGGLAANGYFIGCYFDNSGYGYSTDAAPTESADDPSSWAKKYKGGSASVYDTKGLINSYIDNTDLCLDGMILNCYQSGKDKQTYYHGSSLNVYNSVCSWPTRGKYYNCASRESFTLSSFLTYKTNCLENLTLNQIKLNSDKRPFRAGSLVDKGSKAFYDAQFPAAWSAYKDVDFASGVRVWGREIDIGCGERPRSPGVALEVK